MASNLAGLSNSISNFIKGVGAELGILPNNPAQLFPDFKEVQSSPSLENWNKLSFPYTFDVLNILDNDNVFGFRAFALPIAPSKLNQSEQFAINIKVTQGGSVVNHKGNRFKKLTIEGTTGVNPFRGMTGVDWTTGRAIAKPRELKFQSGYEVFNNLRNYFRAYYQYKDEFPESAQDARLIFKNFKDGEFLVVELLNFDMDRTAPRSLLYDYKMEFKVLAHYTFNKPEKDFFGKLDDAINSVVSKIDVARGILLGGQEVLRQAEASYDQTVLEPMRKIGLVAKAAGGLAITAGDIGNRIIKNTVTAFGSLNVLRVIKEQQDLNRTGQSSISPAIGGVDLPRDLQATANNEGAQAIVDLDEALYDIPLEEMPEKTQEALDEEIEELLDLPRSFYEDSINDFERVRSNIEDLVGLPAPELDLLFERTSTLQADPDRVPTDLEFSILGALNDAISATETLITFDDLFKSDYSRRIETINDSFRDSLDLQALPAVKQIFVPADTDLEQIALEELGNAERWVEIAELNDLNAPYITQDLLSEDSNLKKPGDPLLIPQEIRFGFSDVPRSKDTPITEGLSELERSLGTDLKLTENQDLSLGNNSDLELVAGIPNIGQAVVIRIGYERGELRNHPELGVGIQVGTKFLSIEQARDNLISTLTQDRRIDRVSNISLLREGSSLYMNFDVHIKNVDVPIPLTVRL